MYSYISLLKLGQPSHRASRYTYTQRKPMDGCGSGCASARRHERELTRAHASSPRSGPYQATAHQRPTAVWRLAQPGAGPKAGAPSPTGRLSPHIAPPTPIGEERYSEYTAAHIMSTHDPSLPPRQGPTHRTAHTARPNAYDCRVRHPHCFVRASILITRFTC